MSTTNTKDLAYQIAETILRNLGDDDPEHIAMTADEIRPKVDVMADALREIAGSDGTLSDRSHSFRLGWCQGIARSALARVGGA